MRRPSTRSCFDAASVVAYETVTLVLVAPLHATTFGTSPQTLTVTRGAGFAQYGGLPVVIESHFHIPEQEYRRRRMLPWPGAGNGAFVPRDERAKQPPKPPRKPGPTVTGEVIGDDDPLAGLDDLFGRPGSPPPRTPPRRKELDL